MEGRGIERVCVCVCVEKRGARGLQLAGGWKS